MDRRTALLGLGFVGVASTLAIPAHALGGMASAAVLEAGGFSLQTSQLAMERARNKRLRDFAQLEANEQIAVAAAMGATPGSVPLRPDHAAMLQELAAMSGSRFDTMYLQGQIAGHRELLALNEPIARGGSGGREQAVALISVPAIQTHLYMLQGIGRT
jgi:putative membrane protein